MKGSLRVDRPDVIDDDFQGEAVVMQLRTGVYYSFNRAATEVWHLLAEPRNAAALLDAVGGAAADFLQQLIDERLVVLDPHDGAHAPVAPFVLDGVPELQRFNDMQDLLLLDPVHDIVIDGDGWPARPGA